MCSLTAIANAVTLLGGDGQALLGAELKGDAVAGRNCLHTLNKTLKDKDASDFEMVCAHNGVSKLHADSQRKFMLEYLLDAAHADEALVCSPAAASIASHSVCVKGGLVYDGAFERAMPLSRDVLNIACGGKLCDGVLGLRIVRRKPRTSGHNEKHGSKRKAGGGEDEDEGRDKKRPLAG